MTDRGRFGLRAALKGAVRDALSRARSPAAAPAPAAAPVLTLDGGPSAALPYDTPLLTAAAQLGADLDHFCGALASCGTCRVEVLAGANALSPADARERMVLGDAKVKAGDRLACQARLRGPVTIRIPAYF
jgi:ferredoxin